MYTRIANTFRILSRTVARYPLMLTSALLFLIAVQGLIDRTYGGQFYLFQLAFSGSLGISLFFAIAMLGQRMGRSWGRIGNLLVIGFLLIFYFFVLPSDEKDFTERYLYILVPLYLLSHLLVAIAPFLFRKGHATDPNAEPITDRHAEPRTDAVPDRQHFWHYNKTLFINIFLTAVFTFVLAGGTLLALLAMNRLFDLGWHEDLYLRVFFCLAILGSTLIFALFHTDGLEEMERPSPYPVIIQFFTQFVLIPLLLLYAGILYVYGTKILIDWELPRGWVSYLVLAYGVLGILALLLVDPLLRDGSGKSWVGWFRRLFYYSMLPLLVLLFTAITTRIGQYGFTEARYFVLLLALWLTFVSLYFILARSAALRTIPITLFFVGIAALVLPFVNVYSVSIRSQKQAVMDLLTHHDLLANGQIRTDQPVKSELVNELQDKYTYLAQRQQQAFIHAMLDTEQVAALDEPVGSFRNVFSDITHVDKHDAHAYFEIKSQNRRFDVSSFGQWVHLTHADEVRFSIGQDSLMLYRRLHGDDRGFSLTANAEKIDLLHLVAEWVDQNASGTGNQTVDEIVIPFRIGPHEGILVLEHIHVSNRSDGSTDYFFDRADLFFRK